MNVISGTNACLKLDGARGKPPCLFFRVLSSRAPACLPSLQVQVQVQVGALQLQQEASSNLCTESTLNTLWKVTCVLNRLPASTTFYPHFPISLSPLFHPPQSTLSNTLHR